MKPPLGLALALLLALSALPVTATPANAGPTPGCAPAIISPTAPRDDPDDNTAIEGTDCPELIVATPETEMIDAGDGDDVVIGAPGVVEIDAGSGEDTVYANGAEETTGGADDDQVFGDVVPELGGSTEVLESALMPFVDEFGVEAVEAAVEQAGSEKVSTDKKITRAAFASFPLSVSDPIEGGSMASGRATR